MKFTPSTLTQLTEHISRSPNREVCGLLCGGEDVDSVISRILILTNHAKEHSRFEIKFDELVQYGAMIHKNGLKVHAMYHSHTSGIPLPSHSDVRLARDTQIPHVIFALKGTYLYWTEILPDGRIVMR